MSRQPASPPPATAGGGGPAPELPPELVVAIHGLHHRGGSLIVASDAVTALAAALPAYVARLRAEWEQGKVLKVLPEIDSPPIVFEDEAAARQPAPDLEAALVAAVARTVWIALGHPHQIGLVNSVVAAVLPLLAAERARAERLQKRFDLIDHPPPVEGNPSTDDLIRWSRESAAIHDDWAEHHRQNAADPRSAITGDAEWNRHHGDMHRATAERLEDLRARAEPAEPAPEELQGALKEAANRFFPESSHRHRAEFREWMLTALSLYRWQSAVAELRLRDALETISSWSPPDKEPIKACIGMVATADTALTAQPSPDADALAELVALPGKMLELADIDLAEQRACDKCSRALAALLRRCGLEPAP